MEILRFEESETPAPKRKRASKGWVALGLAASLMGVSTAFASSTININGNNLTPLGQGVSTAIACDNSITVTPDAGLDLPVEDTNTVLEELKPTFTLAGIRVADINNLAADPETGSGCLGLDFKIQVFKNQEIEAGDFRAVALSCSQLGLSGYDFVDGASNSQCVESENAIYFKVQDPTAYVHVLSSADFDYITLVSTSNHNYSHLA